LISTDLINHLRVMKGYYVFLPVHHTLFTSFHNIILLFIKIKKKKNFQFFPVFLKIYVYSNEFPWFKTTKTLSVYTMIYPKAMIKYYSDWIALLPWSGRQCYVSVHYLQCHVYIWWMSPEASYSTHLYKVYSKNHLGV
jgi:hypothetical protein